MAELTIHDNARARPQPTRRALSLSLSRPYALAGTIALLLAALLFSTTHAFGVPPPAGAAKAPAAASGPRPSSTGVPQLTLTVGEGGEAGRVATTLEILLFLTVLTLAPAVLILMTSFTRIIVVLSFLRHAMATQQMPPNQVLVGLALILTFFVMSPALGEIHDTAIQPYAEGAIGQAEMFQRALAPLRAFMLRQTRERDLLLFAGMAGITDPAGPEDIPTRVLLPSFVISELRIAFQTGFVLYIPFLVIDMVVASVLMSMGMMMLPPIMVSLPFKVLLFVLVDGWYLIVQSLVAGFA